MEEFRLRFLAGGKGGGGGFRELVKTGFSKRRHNLGGLGMFVQTTMAAKFDGREPGEKPELEACKDPRHDGRDIAPGYRTMLVDSRALVI